MRDLNAHSEFFIPFSWRRPASDYLVHVEKMLPIDWRPRQDYFWTQAIGPKPTSKVQGWKIHVSATLDNAVRILEKVVPVCIDHATEFKFASDPRILRQLLGKNCGRSQSGKFITVYPENDAIFRELLQEIDNVTRDESGPYVLSDRQYRDSSVVYYRYGGFKDLTGNKSGDDRKALILDRDFSFIEDHRAPFFQPPPFVAEELSSGSQDVAGPQPDSDQTLDEGLFGGEFRIDSAIKFCNFGGVYAATRDSDGAPVIIKEARPHVGGEGQQAVDVLKKEARLLGRLSGTGIAPKPIKLFYEWTHLFLAQEKVEGWTLKEYQARKNRLTHSNSDDEQMREWVRSTIRIAINLLEAVSGLHQMGIVFGDISTNNVMVDPDSLRVKMIDFEGAFEPGVDTPANLYTPGYASKSRRDRDIANFEDDHYALGSVMVAMLLSNAAVTSLDSGYAERLLREVTLDIGLPREYGQCVKRLLSQGGADLEECVELLESATFETVHAFGSKLTSVARTDAVRDFCAAATDGYIKYCADTLDLSRRERIFPLGAKMSDPLAVDHGVAGVVYAWARLAGSVPEGLKTWVSNRVQDQPDRRGVGLLEGGAGTAWVLAEIGLRDEAMREIRRVQAHRSLYEDMSLGKGAAGFGLTCLHLWLKYGEEARLKEAVRTGEVLLARMLEVDEGVTWWQHVDSGEGVPVGLYEGAAGVALFLLYLYCATGKASYLEAGSRALEHDVAFGRMAGSSLGFPQYASGAILYPYLQFGSAGIASVALRYQVATARKNGLEVVESTFAAIANKYAAAAGLHLGLAGLGNCLLDMADLLGDPKYLDRAHWCAEGIRLFAVERGPGIAFPDDNGLKINLGYGRGASGVTLFLHRLHTGGPNFDFKLDSLLGLRNETGSSLVIGTREEPVLEGA